MVLEQGEKVAPRGMETIEVQGLSIVSNNPAKRFFAHPSRRANPIFPIVELMWYLRGEDSIETISHYMPTLRRYVNAKTGIIEGAYGPRLIRYEGKIDQLASLYRRLKVDPQSRRAVLTLFDPMLDFRDESFELPCYTQLQFLVRKGCLDMFAYARSQDMFRGFVYDSAVWQLLQEVMARWLGLELGKYHLIIASAHIYVSDVEKARLVIEHDSNFDLYKNVQPTLSRYSYDQFASLKLLYDKIESMARLRLPHTSELSAVNTSVAKTIETVHDPFWKDALRAIVAFNSFKARRDSLGQMYLAQIKNELKVALQIWIKRQVDG
jgi:thymidylate synthase